MNVLRRLRNRWLPPKTEVHLYALCWNEEKMLPYFFRHYDQIVSRYFIFDNGSTDRSLEMLRQNSKVTLGSFEVKGDSFVAAALKHYQECWKQSRGQADWVIVCNVDEHFYHPDLLGYLTKCKELGITQIIPEGYNMVADQFPTSDKPLYRTVRYGMRDLFWDKPEIFDPNSIEEINFAPGRHTATPVGKIITPRHVRVKLLHFKYIGLEYLVRRHSELKTGLRPRDIQNDWGNQYLWDQARSNQEYQRILTNAVRVL